MTLHSGTHTHRWNSTQKGCLRNLIKPLALIWSLCLLATLLSCQRAPDETSTSDPLLPVPTTTGSVASFGGVLTVRLRDDVATLNPLIDDQNTAKISALVFSGLLKLDPTLRPVPDLAESWSSSPDELVWTFKLRPGVKWHDGVTLSSDDVLFTYGLLMDSANAPSNASASGVIAVTRSDFQQMVEQVEAPDAYTIRLRLRQRFAPLLADLAVPILPRHVLKDWSSAKLAKDQITTGTGPFRFAEQRGTNAMILDAFPEYFLGRPYLDRVAFVSTADDTAVTKSLLDGNLLLAEVSSEASASLLNVKSVTLLSYPEPTFYHVGFNLRSGHLFSDRALREAWVAAVDKTRLVESSLGSSAQPVNGDIPVYSWAYEPAITDRGRDIDKARALLDGAGWQETGPDGIRVRAKQRLSIELGVRQDAPSRIRLARELAAQLREVGIEARVAPSDFNSTMAAARRPPFDFAALLMGWTMGADPDDYYLFHSSQIPTGERSTGHNYVGFSNEEFDRLSVQARTTVDPKRRADLYRQTQRILGAEAPYQFLWSDRSYYAVASNLRGLPETFSPAFWSTIREWQLVRN